MLQSTLQLLCKSNCSPFILYILVQQWYSKHANMYSWSSFNSCIVGIFTLVFLESLKIIKPKERFEERWNRETEHSKKVSNIIKTLCKRNIFMFIDTIFYVKQAFYDTVGSCCWALSHIFIYSLVQHDGSFCLFCNFAGRSFSLWYCYYYYCVLHRDTTVLRWIIVISLAVPIRYTLVIENWIV